MSMLLPDAIPAATVVLMRAGPGGAPEILMVERAAAMKFAGGALVFPGGRVDPDDRVVAGALADFGAAHGGGHGSAHGADIDELAARVAAIRESLEETGVAPGLMLAADRMAELRRQLHAGEPFGALLRAFGGRIDLNGLVPFARWRPDFAPRVFDTRFYLARLPEHAPDPVADAGESVRAFWASASSVLAMADAGEATIIFPTRRNLERLATYSSFAEAAGHAMAHPVRLITPWTEKRADGAYLCIPDDCGYPVTAERLDSVRRA